MFMSSSRAKEAVFNASALTFGLGLAVYLTLDLMGLAEKESAQTNMGRLFIITLVIFVVSLIYSFAFRSAIFKSAKFLAAVFLLALIVSFRVTQFSFLELLDDAGTAGAGRLFSGLAHANWALLPEAIIEVLETIFVAFLATAIAVPLAFGLAFFCSKNIMSSVPAFAVYALLRTVLNWTRSIEPLIWAVIFSVWVGIGPFAGMLALMLHSVASLTKQYSEIIEGVDEGPIDGIRATGANKIQVVWFGIVPQVILPYIAFTFYRWDINVRMATVIGLAGGGGIGTMLLKYQGQAMWPEVGCIIFVIAAVVWLMDTASAYVREAVK
jgi:phosphonate transport system permease protein